jgi:tRNA uridine 5-carboxymethylaminomethyl modification enzyme
VERYDAGQYDIAVIGAGHAGCEAALASARLGLKTIVFAINLDSIGNMPCNPSIGGTAKGHLVREIDALGGEMGKVADATFIQSRMLNKGKGPAVYSLRVQSDRRKYQEEMKKRLEMQENLDIKQAEVVEILTENNTVTGVVTYTGATFKVKSVIIATGTFLRGKIIIGDVAYSGGPDGLFAANSLTQSLEKIGVKLMRFKTGTPARINANSVDFSKFEVQKGDENITPFSFETKDVGENKICCYLSYTNEKTHEIIRQNLHRSPLYSGKVEGIGPRYCPSIEDKVVRFADKERHQFFLEPLGINTNEIYVQGLSSSLPEDVQIAFLRSIPGLENVHMMRTAYAIEYDCIQPTQLKPSLEFKEITGLYGAGQFNGSSGYEEAAAQGLMAGINAARKLQGKPPVVLSRAEAYIGVLIDDLVTKGTNEPYRMLTARAEHRLLLRQDNADLRLTPLGHEIGLISDERYNQFLEMKDNIEKEIKRLEKKVLPPSDRVNEYLTKMNSTNIKTGIHMSELLKRPEITYESLKEVDDDFPNLEGFVANQIEITVKYEGYIKRQTEQAQQAHKLDNKLIPEDIDYANIHGLRLEARQKLAQMKPVSVGQASRISGVSPADIAVLLVYLKSLK